MGKESIADLQVQTQRSNPARMQPAERPKTINLVIRQKESAIWPFLTGAFGSAAFWLVFWGLFLGPAV